MIDEVFQSFYSINQLLESEVVEISVKRSQLVFTFLDELIITMDDLLVLNKLDDNLTVSDVTCFQNRLYIAIRDIDSDKVKNDSVFYPLMIMIKQLRDLVCSCPALEYVVSGEYIKVFLDVPNIKVSDLMKTLDAFKQDPFVELTGDRPYLLFINEDAYITEEIE